MGFFTKNTQNPIPGKTYVDTPRIQQIVTDSLSIMEKTKNVDTFLSRLDDCLTFCTKLNAKTKQNTLQQINSAYPSILKQFVQNAISDADKLKTPASRVKRLTSIASQLSSHSTGQNSLDSLNREAANTIHTYASNL